LRKPQEDHNFTSSAGKNNLICPETFSMITSLILSPPDFTSVTDAENDRSVGSHSGLGASMDVEVRFLKNSALLFVSSYDDLICQVQRHWTTLKRVHFTVMSAAAPHTEITALSFAAITQPTTSRKRAFHDTSSSAWKIQIRAHTRGFLYYGQRELETMELLNLKFNAVMEDVSAFPLDSTVPEHVYDEEARACQRDLNRRTRVLLSESSVRERISPVLISAMLCTTTVMSNVKMICGKTVVGRKAHGFVAYAMSAGLPCLVVTEAKLDDMNAGRHQNHVQQLATVESTANSMLNTNAVGVQRACAYDTAFKAARLVGCSGIISTGRLYQFSRLAYTAGSDQATIVVSPELELSLLTNTSEACVAAQLAQIKLLLKTIVHILRTQQQVITDSEAARAAMIEGRADLHLPHCLYIDAIETAASRELTEAQNRQDAKEALGSDASDEEI
jgi:hypothetical protein